MEINKIYRGDSLEVLKSFSADSIDCAITSPPYWGLRDYGVSGQLGLEKTPEEYVEKMVELFREVRRVLKPEGTLWLNLGDTYSAQRWSNNKGTGFMQTGKNSMKCEPQEKHSGLPDKNLVGIPWRVAFALQANGWYLRQDIIWAKPNPMPESVTDRCTKSHEYVFLMSKSPRYYFDNEAIKERCADGTAERLMRGVSDHHKNVNGAPGQTPHSMNKPRPHKSAVTPGQSPQGKALRRMEGEKDPEYPIRNKRSVWTITTKPFKEAHFATFPEQLIEPMIKAGCPKGGIVLDPFMGAGTTGLVAKKLGRNYIGIELNEKYIEIAEKRINQYNPLL